MMTNTAPLGELVNVQTGKLDANASSANGAYPFFTCAREPLRIADWKYDLDAILIAGNGDLNVKHYIGKFDAYQRTYILDVKKTDVLDSRFLFHFMDKYVERLREQSIGGIIKYIKLGMLTEAKIPLPPLEEQKRIAGILDQADALRRLRTRALDKLNTLGQAIFHEMFGDVARNSMDWPMGCIGDLLEEAKYGSSAKANTEGKGLPMLRMGNLTYDGQIDLTSLKHVELSDSDFEKYTTRKGDLLFNRTNSKELVGKTAVVKQEQPLAFAGYLVRGRANELGNTDYISAYLNSSHGKATLVGMCKNIVGMANINAKEMQKIRIAIPPKDLQDQFSVAIDALAPERKKLLDAIDLQGTLFASLQHRAFQGEL